MISIWILEPWQKRLLAEYWQLEEKIDVLKEFLDDDKNQRLLAEGEWKRLFEQWERMTSYLEILHIRIQSFTDPIVTA